MMKTCFHPGVPWFRSAVLHMDLGFLGAKSDYASGSDIRLPHKKPRVSKRHPTARLTDAQKEENRQQAKSRVVVEHAFGGMKHFHCLAHRIRNRSAEVVDGFFGLSGGLWNFKIL
jgi:hypothetical protein